MRSVLFVALLCSGCAARQPSEAPPRSPSHDYDPPTARSAADGEVIGVDQQRPADTLATSPRLGTQGPQLAEQPGYVTAEQEEKERKRKRLCGGREPDAQGNCPEAPKSPTP